MARIGGRRERPLLPAYGTPLNATDPEGGDAAFERFLTARTIAEDPFHPAAMMYIGSKEALMAGMPEGTTGQFFERPDAAGFRARVIG